MTLDWKFALSIFVALVGVLVPIGLWQLDSGSRGISVRLISSVEIQPLKSPAMSELQISVDGLKLEAPFISTIELRNDGSKPISASDFESALEVGVNDGIRIVRARIASSQPSDIRGDLAFEAHVLKLQPLLLNPNDSLTLAVISAGGNPVFTPRARIVGINKIAFEDATKTSSRTKAIALYLPLSLLTFVLNTIFALAVVRPLWVPLYRPLSFLVMLSCSLSASLYMRLAFEGLSIENNTSNRLVFTSISALVAVSVLFGLISLGRRKSRLNSVR